MATLKVTCSPAVHTDGTHHTVQVDPPGGASQQADANGVTTFYNLTTGQHAVYVCGIQMGTPVVSGYSIFNASPCSVRVVDALVFAAFDAGRLQGVYPERGKLKVESADGAGRVYVVDIKCEGDGQVRAIAPGKYGVWAQMPGPGRHDWVFIENVTIPGPAPGAPETMDEPWIDGVWTVVKSLAAKKPAAKKDECCCEPCEKPAAKKSAAKKPAAKKPAAKK